jgi:hypothetical protein
MKRLGLAEIGSTGLAALAIGLSALAIGLASPALADGDPTPSTSKTRTPAARIPTRPSAPTRTSLTASGHRNG